MNRVNEKELAVLRDVNARLLEETFNDHSVALSEVTRCLDIIEVLMSGKDVEPFNYRERVQYILAQPSRFHARVQLRELIDEFIKKYVVWQAKNTD